MFMLGKFVKIVTENAVGKVEGILRLSTEKTFVLVGREWHHVDDVQILDCAANKE